MHVYNVVMFKKKDPLGQFEFLVLTAVLELRDNAYGLAVTDRVAELAGRKVSAGAVYLTLDRMEDKGFVKSWYANATPERGGNHRRYFQLLALGERVLSEATETAKRVIQAVEAAGGRWRSGHT
jgi:PadR family transcriptional regulator PadR